MPDGTKTPTKNLHEGKPYEVVFVISHQPL